jgi:hypothetical protein
MLVTSDALFHFTSSLELLKSILTQKFKITYCHETYTLDGQEHDYYYPMVSFCDIPLSAARKQMSTYGSYAIGLNKNWAIKHNLNPVIYIDQNSEIGKDINTTLKQMQIWMDGYKQVRDNIILTLSGDLKQCVSDIMPDLTNYEASKPLVREKLIELSEKVNQAQDSLKSMSSTFANFRPLFQSYIPIYRYIKNYDGLLKREGKKPQHYRYYDEREWRYAPSNFGPDVKSSLTALEYKNRKIEQSVKPYIMDQYLTFNSQDISYLLVKTNSDIPKLIKHINGSKTLYVSSDEKDILTTKILTAEQIEKDF